MHKNIFDVVVLSMLMSLTMYAMEFKKVEQKDGNEEKQHHVQYNKDATRILCNLIAHVENTRINDYCMDESAIIEQAKSLLDKGADVNTFGREKFLYTMLHVAARLNYIRLARFLLEHGANVNAVDNEGRAVIYYTGCFPHHSEMIKLLLEHGTIINIPNSLLSLAFVSAYSAEKNVPDVFSVIRLLVDQRVATIGADFYLLLTHDKFMSMLIEAKEDKIIIFLFEQLLASYYKDTDFTVEESLPVRDFINLINTMPLPLSEQVRERIINILEDRAGIAFAQLLDGRREKVGRYTRTTAFPHLMEFYQQLLKVKNIKPGSSMLDVIPTVVSFVIAHSFTQYIKK